jgi:hypothetical protein
LPYKDSDRLVSVGIVVPQLGASEIMWVAPAGIGVFPKTRLISHPGVSLGGGVSDEKDQRGAETVALFSRGMWRTNFARTAAKRIVLNGAPTRII